MQHRLRDGLSWCICNHQTVFLDLPRDRYFRLGPDHDKSFQQWSHSGTLGEGELGPLIKIGILVPCDSQGPPPAKAQMPLPTADLADEPGPTARVIDIGRCLVAQRRAASIIRRGGLANRIAAITGDRDVPAAAHGKTAEHVRRIASAFASTPLAFTKAGQCLPRALAAHGLCRTAGAVPTLVFGIQLQPFAAHCWVQWGTKLIVGDLEQARMYTPILAVP